MELNEWYRLRNDRTNRIDGILLDSNAEVICVHVKRHDDFCSQVMAIAAANIMARWCRRIIIYLPDDVLCLIERWSGQMLHEVIKNTMVSADPYGDFTLKTDYDDTDVVNYNLTIGRPTNSNHFWINAQGWVAGFGYGTLPNEIEYDSEDMNPVGAIYAASFVNSVIFSSYIDKADLKPFERWHTLFDFRTSTCYVGLKNPIAKFPLDIGKVWQIGAGAVGSSFNFLLSLIPVVGNIHILDYDKIEIPNTSSSLVFNGSDALNGSSKVQACMATLEFNKRLSIIGHPDMDYAKFISLGFLEKGYPDLVLCFANEKNIWSTIQNNEPPTVLHATTSSNWAVNFGRHIPFKEWCIVCRFGIVTNNYTPICSSGVRKIEDKPEEKLGILPFLSPVAAVLILAEIIKMNMLGEIEYPANPNFAIVSLKDVLDSNIISFARPPKKNCPICVSQDETNYHKGYRKSKYYM